MARVNPYAAAPLCVAEVDPATLRYTQAVVFLGGVPRAVLEAARRGGGNKLAWTAADASTLAAHYGPGWRALLTPADPPAAARGLGASLVLGGAEFGDSDSSAERERERERERELEFANAARFGDLSELDREPAAPAEAAGPTGALKKWPAQPKDPADGRHKSGAPKVVFSEIAVYPEDTVFDLRLKLCAALRVPPWRAHLFYYVGFGGADCEGPVAPYRITLDGVPLPVDWRALGASAPGASAPGASAAPAAQVAGLTVDPAIEARHEGLHVEALDTFTVLAPLTEDFGAEGAEGAAGAAGAAGAEGAEGTSTLRAAGARIVRAYFIDLASVILPEQRAALGAALRDRYQFDLLYYSVITRYWPQLSPDAASRALAAIANSHSNAFAIANAKDPLAEAYPALAPDPAALAVRFAGERAAAEAARAWRPAAEQKARGAVAVTAATLRVAPAAARMRVATRNVFDWVDCSGAPARAGAGAAGARGPARAGAGVGAVLAARVRFEGPAGPLTATKRAAASFIGPAAPAVDAFIARPTRRGSASFAVARASTAQAAVAPVAVLMVHGDGRYEVAAEWREDDRVGFGAVRAEVAAATAPVLAHINAMGAAAFPIGGNLGELAESGFDTDFASVRQSQSLGQITASVFWPRALSAAAFRELKASFRELEAAQIISVRGLQLSGVFQIAFKKGVTAYDRRQLGNELANQYAWLTDPIAAARWAALFGGRGVRIFHRATDLQVEIARADSLAEFCLIQSYLFAHLDAWAARHLRAGAGPHNRAGESGSGHARRLRRLQERDPQLFDLKRHDPNISVYSVVCQSDRQPHIFNAAEAKSLGVRRRAALTEYWNFTEQTPAFYECPDPQFAHLSFRAGVHPLGFCLPCCKKARAPAGSRAAATNRDCLAMVSNSNSKSKSGSNSAAPVGDSAVRHVLAYGKAIAPGRLGALPKQVSEGLFLGVPGGAECVVWGVDQTAPAVPGAGFAFALARALAAVCDDALAADGGDALENLAATAAALGDGYLSLGGGAAAALESAAALAEAIRGAFIRRDSSPSPFSPGGALAAAWPDILLDLTRRSFGLEAIVAFDAEGSGAISLEASAAAAAGVAAGAPFVLLVATPEGTHPVAQLPPKFLAQAAKHPDATWVFGAKGPTAGLAAAVAAAIAAPTKTGSGGGAPPPDMAVLERFLAAQLKNTKKLPWALESRVADLRDSVYGAIITRGAPNESTSRQRAYIPLAYSPAASASASATTTKIARTNIIYGALPAGALPVEDLDAAIADINEYLVKVERRAPYVARAASAALALKSGGLAVGYLNRAAGVKARADEPRLYFHHDPVALAPDQPKKVIYFPYDPREVDQAIAAARLGREPAAAAAAAAAVAAAAAAATARHRIYPLLQAEFAALLSRERNLPLRKSLAAAIANCRFNSTASVANLRREVYLLLASWPDDLVAVRAAIARAYESAVTVSAKTDLAKANLAKENLAKADPIGQAAIAAISATAFAFDRLTITRLQALPSHSETVAAVRALLEPRVAHHSSGAAGSSNGVMNMYVACAEDTSLPRPQCVKVDSKWKLQSNAPQMSDLSDFYDILAADIRNLGKSALVAAATSGVIDAQDFIRRPGEILRVQAASY